MLGHKMFQVLRQNYEVFATCRGFRPEWAHILPESNLIAGVNAEKLESILKVFTEVEPDLVINCIGIVKQFEADMEPIPSIMVNALFPHQLAKLCQARSIRMIHFSTDSVFSGREGASSENDPSNAEDLYGRTKYLGEVIVDGCMTIRCSIVGRELRNPTGLVEWFLSQRGRKVKGYSKAIYTGLTTTAMSNVVNKIIINHTGLSGVWHVASEGISKYDLLRMIKDKMNLNIEIEKDEHFMCDRRLDGSKFVEKTGILIPSWAQMIDELSDESIQYDSWRKRRN